MPIHREVAAQQIDFDEPVEFVDGQRPDLVLADAAGRDLRDRAVREPERRLGDVLCLGDRRRVEEPELCRHICRLGADEVDCEIDVVNQQIP